MRYGQQEVYDVSLIQKTTKIQIKFQAEKKNVAGPQCLQEVEVGAQSGTVSTFFFYFLKLCWSV